VHDGVPHLLYTGVRGQLTLPCLATAADPGLVRWSCSERNPVIDRWPPEPGVVAFRDHTAWRSGAAWYQVIGGGLADRGGALFLYRSRDLRDWRYLGVFAAAADHGLPGAIWECPDVFTLGDVTVVVVSVADDGPPRAMWMTGRVAGDRFRPAASGPCDGGNRYYAPQSRPLADGRRIAFGWLRESLGELSGLDRTRVGAMSLPRELSLQAGTLRSGPARELDRARGPELMSQVIEGHGEPGLQLAARDRRASELEVAPVRGVVGAVALRLRGAGPGDIEITAEPGHILVRAGEQQLSTQEAAAGAPRTAALAEPVRVYYDAGILEVYSPDAAPVAVCCDRDGRYYRLTVDVSPAPGQRQAAVRVTGWPAG
jgi:beta-fructofuranosidase